MFQVYCSVPQYFPLMLFLSYWREKCYGLLCRLVWRLEGFSFAAAFLLSLKETSVRRGGLGAFWRVSDETWHCLLYLGLIISSWRCGLILKSMLFCVSSFCLDPQWGTDQIIPLCVAVSCSTCLCSWCCSWRLLCTISSRWPLVPHLHLFERPHLCEVLLWQEIIR